MYNFLFFQKRTSSFPASKLASVLLYKNDTYFQHGSSALEIIIKKIVAVQLVCSEYDEASKVFQTEK